MGNLAVFLIPGGFPFPQAGQPATPYGRLAVYQPFGAGWRPASRGGSLRAPPATRQGWLPFLHPTPLAETPTRPAVRQVQLYPALEGWLWARRSC